MGLETAALIAAGVGSAAQAYGGAKAASANNKRAGQLMSTAQGMMTTAPTQAQTDLTNFAGGGVYGNQSFNAGQDAFMQLLRTQPWVQQSYVTDAIKRATSGTPFNLTPQFDALHATSEQNITDQVNQILAGAGSLGRRFGTGVNTAAAIARVRGATALNEQEQGLATNAWEAAQNRALQGAQIGGTLQLQGGQLGLQTGQALTGAGMDQLQLILQAINQAGQFASTQRAQNINLLGIGAGLPGQQNPYGSAGEGLTGLATLMYLMGNKTPTTVAKVA